MQNTDCSITNTANNYFLNKMAMDCWSVTDLENDATFTIDIMFLIILILCKLYLQNIRHKQKYFTLLQK